MQKRAPKRVRIGQARLANALAELEARWVEILLKDPERLMAFEIGELKGLEENGERLGVKRPNVRVCQHCGIRFVGTLRGRRDQKYHIRACRQAAYRERRDAPNGRD